MLKLMWAKTDKTDQWHPLLLHCLDVAAAALAILEREPRKTRDQLAEALGIHWEVAKPWLLLLISAHDLGKACPGFQCKWKNLSGLNPGRTPNTKINHAFVSQIALAEWLIEHNWPDELARLASDAVGCHHGSRASGAMLETLEGDLSAIGRSEWTDARHELLNVLFEVFQPTALPEKADLSGPEFMLLAGLTSFSDWIGSNTEWFGFGCEADTDNPKAWFEARYTNAEQALDALGWQPRTPLLTSPCSFHEVFGFPPRPLQEAVATVLADLDEPAILLIEAPMGEGKTEAAWFAHLELQRRFEHRGLYIALPTQATGNAMFARTLAFLRARDAGRVLDLQLLHGGTLLNDHFQQLRLASVHDDDAADPRAAQIKAAEWFTHKKRALLSEYGVGTVDQALLPVLPVRHHFVRLWGLANRVVVFDEIHAYDAYTGTLLIHLVRWLHALGSSVLLLSATLPPAIRHELARVVGAELPATEAPYPRLSVFSPGVVQQNHFEADPTRRVTIDIQPIGSELEEIQTALRQQLLEGGMGLALVNTVHRAQALYGLFPEGRSLLWEGEQVGKLLDDGTEIYLFHARFPASQRQLREQRVLDIFGKAGGEQGELRTGRKILIATQVAEQSLDLDFDLIVTDLAPIDLLLQRAGRLWRHPRPQRPVAAPVLLVAGLAGDAPDDFGRPLWWGAVYAESVLLRTWCLLRQPERRQIILPDHIDTLVQAVYEENVPIPETLLARLDKALMASDGDGIAKTQQAHGAIIGLPDDASWDDPARFVLYDEDDPYVHPTLAAQTRLGDESLTVIPLGPADGFDAGSAPSVEQARAWSLRTLRVGRKGLVQQLKALGIPESWQQSPLLRNHFPLCLDEEGRWLANGSVRLDPALGLSYDNET
ncbi:MAG: CRISPR-associated helicase Cas3' [Pseudomonas sagittaria]|nr:CRISPR-associated helicase Cas3' [Pseudomonas sagittaria]